MAPRTQDKFRRRVKTWLLNRNLTVTYLAKRIGRRRDTVSQAINRGKFPRVCRRIEQEIAA